MTTEINSNTYACTASIVGNRETFAQIVQKYQNLVSAVTFSITGNLQQSEDIAQETFITAWEKLGELREPEKLPGWLCGIARNLSHKWIRNPEHQLQNSSDLLLEEIAAPEPESDTIRDEQAALLWSTVREIPEPYREPL
ncbi:MAG: RNA polymerase sigma factor, partial [Thermoguttaceae bacterium]